MYTSVDEAAINKEMGIGYEKRYNDLSSSPYVMNYSLVLVGG